MRIHLITVELKMHTMKNLLRISYFVLIILLTATIAGFLYGTTSNQGWVRDLSLNVGTEILGILLTVFLIDAVIRRNEEKERARIRTLAFQQLRIPLVHHLGVLQGIYKASIANLPEHLPAEVKDLFEPGYFVQIAFFDISKTAPLTSAVSWFDYLKSESEKFRLALGRTIEKYAVFLNATEIELLEMIINSSFLSLVEQTPAIRGIDQKEGYKRTYNLFAGQGMDGLVREYTDWFTQLIALYNNVLPDNRIVITAGMWRNDVAPRVGSARMG